MEVSTLGSGEIKIIIVVVATVVRKQHQKYE